MSFSQESEEARTQLKQKLEIDWWEVWGENYFCLTKEFKFKALSYTEGLQHA